VPRRFCHSIAPVSADLGSQAVRTEVRERLWLLDEGVLENEVEVTSIMTGLEEALLDAGP
jgi:hypothetical protein